jgi:hypothetical protein
VLGRQHDGAPPDFLQLELPTVKHAQSVQVHVVIREGRGVTLLRASTTVRLRKNQPNGARCGLTCYVAGARLDRYTRHLDAL